MKLNIVMIALFCSVVGWVALPHFSQAQTQGGIDVVLTSYTCEETPANPMYPCGVLRWGGNVNAPGMACPFEWRNRIFEVPGYGVLRCDDTPARGYLNGLPHIDVRVPTVAQARRIGIRRITIYPTGQPAATTYGASASQPAEPEAPAAPTAPEDAIYLAHKVVPRGDDDTAMAHLLRGATARQRFPELFEGVQVSDGQALWVVSMWVPPTTIPAGTVAKPRSDQPVAARFFIFDAGSGKLIADRFVSKDVVEIMGWLPDDDIKLGQ